MIEFLAVIIIVLLYAIYNDRKQANKRHKHDQFDRNMIYGEKKHDTKSRKNL